MFSLLDSFTSFCGGDAKVAPTPSSAEVMVKAHHEFHELAEDPAAEAAEAADLLENEAKLTPQEHVIYDAVTKTIVEEVDPMDASNYLVVHLTRPMGILFEENVDEKHGGAFVADVKDGCSAAADGSISCGDQLVAIGTKRVSGMDFDEIMKIIEESNSKIKLTMFRGPAESLHGPLASAEWLDDFVAESEEEAELQRDASAAEVFDVVSETVKAELLNDVAAAVLDEVGNMDEADEKLVDAQPDAEEDKVEVEEVVNSEAIPESTTTEVEEAVVLDNVVATGDEGDDSNVHSETEANLEVGEVPVEDEVDMDEGIEEEFGNMDEADEKLVDTEVHVDEETATEEKLVAAEDEVKVEEVVNSDAVPESSATEVEEADAEAHVVEESAKEEKLVIVEDEDEVEEGNDSDAAAKVDEAVVVDTDMATEDEGDDSNVHAESKVLVDDEVQLDGEECEADLEKDSDGDSNESLVVIESEVEVDVGASVETDQEEGANATNEVADNEVGECEKVDDKADLERKSEASEESLVIVEHEVEADDEISNELAQEPAPTLDEINTAKKDLLDATADESVSTASFSVSEKNA